MFSRDEKDVGYVSSNLTIYTNCFLSSVGLEQLTLNQWVQGPSPWGSTKQMPVYHSILVTVAAAYKWVWLQVKIYSSRQCIWVMVRYGLVRFPRRHKVLWICHILDEYFGLACSKDGVSPLQGESGGFDSLRVHQYRNIIISGIYDSRDDSCSRQWIRWEWNMGRGDLK